MSDEPIPRRLFLKNAGAVAGTAAATGLATSPPAAAQTVTACPAVRSADLILSNAKVITVDRDFTIAQAIAIAGDRILAVGRNDTMAAHTSPETRVVDLKSRTVMPGLIDGHAHMDREGLKSVYPALGPVRSIRDIQERIVELARVTPHGEWIVTMPIGDPPYYFDVPDILAEKRWPTGRSSMRRRRTIRFSSVRSGASGVTACRSFRSPTPRRSGVLASPATRSRRWHR
jgi:hypothetical protein